MSRAGNEDCVSRGLGQRGLHIWAPTPHEDSLSWVPAPKCRGVWPPQVEEFEHDVPNDLGPLQFVKLRKHHSLVDDAWFCDCITVRGPGAEEATFFPCYSWVQGQDVLSLPEGTGEGQGGGGGHRHRGLWGRVGGARTQWVLSRSSGEKTGQGGVLSLQVTHGIRRLEAKKDLESPLPRRGRDLGAAA